MTSMPSSPESMVLRPSLTRAWSSAIRRRATFGGDASLEASSAPPISPKRIKSPLHLISVQRPNKKVRRSLLAISLRQPGCLILERPVGFAPLPRGRFAFIQDARKYTRGNGLVAIRLIAAIHDALRLISLPLEQHDTTGSST